MHKITKCPLCKSSSDHCEEVKVNFCFQCGVSLDNQDLESVMMDQFDMLVDCMDRMSKRLFQRTKEPPIDWDEEWQEDKDRRK